MATAVLANANRNPQVRSEPYQADDFIGWRETETNPVDAEPIFLKDPVAHANLIRAVVFGIAPTTIPAV